MTCTRPNQIVLGLFSAQGPVGDLSMSVFCFNFLKEFYHFILLLVFFFALVLMSPISFFSFWK